LTASYVAERAQVGEHREILLAVSIPEVPGSFLAFCKLLGGAVLPNSITAILMQSLLRFLSASPAAALSQTVDGYPGITGTGFSGHRYDRQ